MTDQPTPIVIPDGADEVIAGLAELFADELAALDEVIVGSDEPALAA